MRLRNKKTGEIKDFLDVAKEFINGKNGKKTFTLAELNEEWEDYDEGTLLWSFRKAEDVPKIIEREDPAEIAEQAREYFNTAIKVKESFMNVNVNLCEDGTLWIDDAKTDEQLAKFKVVEGE